MDELKYKPGDKLIIEIESVMKHELLPYKFKIHGFQWYDEEDLKHLKRYEESVWRNGDDELPEDNDSSRVWETEYGKFWELKMCSGRQFRQMCKNNPHKHYVWIPTNEFSMPVMPEPIIIEPCPFPDCQSKCDIVFVDGEYQVVCQCGYSSITSISKSFVIEKHNKLYLKMNKK